LKLTASNNNRTRHTDVAGLIHDKEFDCFTEHIVRETLKKSISFSQQETKQTCIFPPVADRFSLPSVPAESLMPASATRIFSGKLKTINFLLSARAHVLKLHYG
jgi:hypothetical protein